MDEMMRGKDIVTGAYKNMSFIIYLTMKIYRKFTFATPKFK